MYVILTPNLDNVYSTPTHKIIRAALNAHFVEWKGFHKRKPDYKLSFTIVTKQGVTQVEVKGPDISRRRKEYEYGIFLPEKINDMAEYVDFVFEGIKQVLSNFEVDPSEVEKIKLECKTGLDIPSSVT
jgi:hypothetical protein